MLDEVNIIVFRAKEILVIYVLKTYRVLNSFNSNATLTQAHFNDLSFYAFNISILQSQSNLGLLKIDLQNKIRKNARLFPKM